MNKEDGFSLVELIVVVVILAVLTGVTVAGIQSYVTDARENMDIKYAHEFTKALSTLYADKDVMKWGKAVCSNSAGATFIVLSTKGNSPDVVRSSWINSGFDPMTHRGKVYGSWSDKILPLVPNGTMTPKIADWFLLSIDVSHNGDRVPIFKFRCTPMYDIGKDFNPNNDKSLDGRSFRDVVQN